jgi:hypothetical protein
MEAARLAAAWAGVGNTTRYSNDRLLGPLGRTDGFLEGRTTGVKEAETTPERRVFHLDSLRRIFKWATNDGGDPFSKNRGTTCAAFVTACYQAAWVRYYYNNRLDRIRDVYNILNRAVQPYKLPRDERVGIRDRQIDAGTLGRRALPQHNRVEHEIPQPIWEKIWKDVDDLRGTKLAGIKHIVSPGLFVDAKFNSTLNLLTELRQDLRYWQAGLPVDV